MKKILFILLTFCMSICSLQLSAQDIVEIGNGTSTTYYGPFNSLWGYSFVEQIYTASEINMSGSITSISFNKSSGTAQTNSIVVYMKNVSRSSFSDNTDYETVTAADIVYQGSWAIPSSGWTTITLDNPFAYDGTSNLMIAVHEYTSGYSTQYFYYTSTTNYSMISFHSDSADPNPYSLGSYTGTVYTQSNRPNIRIAIDPSGCSSPRALTASEITNNSATVSWSNPDGLTDWEVYISETTAPDSNTVGIAVTDTFYNFSGLNANTLYTAYVRTYCADSSAYSRWAAVTFRTACEDINSSTLPYTEDFNTYGTGSASNFPICWHRGYTTSSAYPYISSTGGGSLYFYGSPGTYSYATTEALDNSISLNNLMLSFKLYKGSAAYNIKVGVMEDYEDASTFETIATLSPTATSTWEDFDITFEQYTGTGRYIAFMVDGRGENNSKYMYLDDVVLQYIPTCRRVHSLTISEITSDGATISWTEMGSATSWDVAVDSTGYNITTYTGYTNTNNNPYIITGLMGNSTYDVYVRANCGSETSDWSSVRTFTTHDTPFNPASLPYSCDFEDATENDNWTIVNNGYPHAWYIDDLVNNTPGGNYGLYVSQDSGATNTYDIDVASYVWAYRDIDFGTSSGEYLISFDWRDSTESCCDYLKVYIGNPVDVTNVGTSIPAGLATVSTNYNFSSTWRRDTIYANATFQGIKRLYFYWRNDGSVGTSQAIAVDNITVEGIECGRPLNLAVTETSTTSISIEFDAAVSSDNSWDAVIVEHGDEWDETMAINLNSTQYTFTDLTPATTYDIHVRTGCGSNWISLTSVATDCELIYSLPYRNNFDNVGASVMPICWNRLSTAGNYPYTSTSYAYSAPNSMYFYSGSTSNYTIGTLPELDENIDVSTLSLSFVMRSTSTSYSIVVGVLSGLDASSFVPVDTLTLTATNTWEEKEVDFANYTGNGKLIGFKYINSTAMYIDNVALYETSSCLKPVNVQLSNISSESVTIDWTPRNGEGSWSVVVVPHGDDPETGNIEFTSEHPYTVEGLSDATSYDVYVKADCGTESPWSTAVSFKTLCLPTNDIPYTENFDEFGASHSGQTYYPTCWTRITNNTSTNYPYISTSYHSTGTSSLYFYSTSDYYSLAVSQGLDLSQYDGSSLLLSFKLRTTSTSYGRMDVGVITDPSDLSTFTSLKSIYPSDYANTSNFFDFEVAIPAQSENTVYLAFLSPRGTTNYVYLDDVNLSEGSCSAPSHLTISSVAGTSALVSWDAAMFEPDEYIVEYTEAGQDNWQTLSETGTSSILSGLIPETSYQVRVYGNCMDGTTDTLRGNFTTTGLVSCDVSVGNGTTTNYYIPVNNFYRYTFSEQIFLASEMNGAGTINNISFDYAYSSATSSKTDVDIYLKHTSQSTFSSSSNYIDTTGAQLVYHGHLNCHQGWNTFNFTTPFQYNGTDNLVLIVDDNSNDYDGNSYVFNVHAAGASRTLFYYSDSDNPGLNNLSSFSDNKSTSTNRNNVIFGLSCDSTITCVAPNIYDYSFDNESITINWVAGNGETAWELRYKSATDNDWTIETVNDSPYTIENLTANTAYTVGMRSDCGSGEYSDWTGFNVTTYCDFVSLPLHEDFESLSTGATAAFLPCWFKGTNSSTAYPYVNTQSSAPNGTKTLYFNGSTTTYSYAATPRFDEEVLMDSLQITFNAYKGSASYLIEVGIMSDPTDYSTFELVGSFSPTATSTWQAAEILTRGYNGNGRHVAFRTPQWFSNTMYIDDINIDYIPNCLHVTNLHTTSVESSTATIVWQAGGEETEWEVILVEGNGGAIPDEEATIESIQETPSYTAEDLSSASFYTIYVRANCGNSYSAWERLLFQTTQIPGQLPYFCDFEESNSQFGFVNTGSTNQWHIGTATNNGGTHAMYISQNNGVGHTYNTGSTSNVWAYRDIYFPACANGYTFSFDWHAYGESCCDYMKVYWGNPVNIPANSTSDPAGATAMQPSVNSSYADRFNTLTGQGYQTFTTTLPGLTTGAVKRIYFYWHNDGSVGNNPPAAIDNISISAIYCAAPTNLTANNVTAYTADIEWTSTASSCVLYYKANNEDEWIIDENATSPYPLSGLNGNTTYTVRVANNCDDGENTSPFITTTFTTSCVAMTTLPYEENFDNIAGSTSTSTNVLPNCWSRFNGGTTYDGMPTVYQTTSSHSGSNCLYFYTYSSDSYHDQYAVLPEIDATVIPLNTVMMSFSARSYSTSYPFIIQVGVLSDPADSSSFQLVQTITVTGTSYVTKEAYFNDFTGTGSHIAIKVAKPTSNYNYGYIDDIVLSVAPSCSPVNNLTVSNVAGSSAMISWEAGHFGTVSSYTLEYSEAGQESWIEASGNITGTSYILSGLEQLTSYDVRVKVNCDNSDESEWVEESFTTRCLAGGELQIGNGTTTNSYIPSYSTYENGYTQQLFTASEMGGAATITSISFDMAAVSQQRHFKIYLMHTTANDLSTGWIPASTAQQKFSGNHTFTTGWNTFDFSTPFNYNGTDNLLLIVIDENDSWTGGNSWHVHDAFAGSTRYTYQDNTPYSIGTTPSATGTVLSVRNNVIFGGNCDSTATCFAPNMFVDNITENSADVIWVAGYDESSWELEYTLYGDSVWTPVNNVTGGTVTIDQLTSNTHYSVRMRSDCGGGDYSTWTMTDFRTECSVITVPFTENFDNMGTGSAAYPSCWTRHNDYSTSTNYPNVSSSYHYSGNASLYFYCSTSTYNMAILPPVDPTVDPLGNLMLSFMMRSTSSTTSQIIVGVMTDPNEISTFIPIDTVNNSATGIFELMEIPLNSYTGDAAYVAMKLVNSSSTYSVYIDDVVLDVIPTCMKPQNLTSTASTTTSITLSWTPGGNENNWNIEYGPAGFTQGTGTTMTGVTNPVTISNLSPSTSYTFYVQADCSGGDLSHWSLPYSTNTECGAVATLPYTESFDSYGTGSTSSPNVYPTCWEKINTYSSERPFINSGGHSAPGCLYFYAGNSGTYNIAITPEFDASISINTLKAKFWHKGSNSSDRLIVGVTSSITDANSFVPVDTVYISTTSASTWHECEVSFANYSGNGHYIAFKNEYTTTYAYAYIDDLIIEEDTTLAPPPVCNVPTGLATANLTYNAVDVNWSAGGNETAWNVQYKQASAANWGNSIAVTSATYHISGLAAETSYQVRVQANCGADGTSDWTTPVSFTTPAAPVDPCNAPTNLQVSNITENSATVSWTAGGSETAWNVQYKLQSASQWQEANVQTTSYLIEGLTANSTYDVRVKAVCAVDNQSDFVSTSFTTTGVGIDNISLANSISLMPNPADNYIELSINSNVEVKEAIVYNAFGQMIQTVQLTENHARIDLSNMAAGMYFVRVNGEGVTATKKFIKR